MPVQERLAVVTPDTLDDYEFKRALEAGLPKRGDEIILRRDQLAEGIRIIRQFAQACIARSHARTITDLRDVCL